MTINYVANSGKVAQLIVETEMTIHVTHLKVIAIWGIEPSENDKKELEDFMFNSAKETYQEPFSIVVENQIRDQ